MADAFDPIADFANTEAGQPASDLLRRDRRDREDDLDVRAQKAAQEARDIEAFGLAEQREGHNDVLNQIPGAMEVNPDALAELLTMARETNFDTRILLGESDHPAKQVRSNYLIGIMEAFLKRNPRALTFLQDPENITLIYDDIPALISVHQALQELQRSEADVGLIENVKGVGAAFVSTLEQAAYGIGLNIVTGPDEISWFYAYSAMTSEEKAAFTSMTPEEQSAWLGEREDRFRRSLYNKDLEAVFEADLAEVTAELQQIRARAPETGVAWFLRSTAEAVTQMVPALAAGFVAKSPGLALQLLGTQAFGNRYAHARLRSKTDGRGFTKQDIFAEALFFAALEVFSEKIPLGILLREGGRGLRGILQSMGAEAIQEAFVQAVDIGFELKILNEEMTLGEAAQALFDAGVIGAGVGGTLRSSVEGAHALADISGLRRAGDDAQDHETRLTEAQKAVAETKLTARSPEKMREYLEQTADEVTVHISAEDIINLQQTGVLTDEIMADLGLTEEMAATLARNGDFEISVAKLLTLDEAAFEALAPSVRQTPDALSAREATQQVADRDALIETLVKQMEEQIAADPEARPIFDAVSASLSATGQFTPAEVQQQAELAEATYQTRAENLEGVTAEELFLEENVQIRGPQDTTRNAATIALNQQQVPEGTVFHVTPTRNVEGIASEGIRNLQPSNFVLPEGSRANAEGGIFVFDNADAAARAAARFEFDLGEPVSIIPVQRGETVFEADPTGDPNFQNTGSLRTFQNIDAASLGQALDFSTLEKAGSRGISFDAFIADVVESLDNQAQEQAADMGINEALPLEQGDVLVSKAPKKKKRAYKLFRTNPKFPGQLFPLFVENDKGVPIGKWIDAEIGPMKEGKVKSSIGNLAMRPGWHSGDLPVASHIGGKSQGQGQGKPDYRPDNQVWALVEVPNDVDWQSEANSRAETTKAGKPIARTAHITDQVPEGGHYKYKTNPNMTGEWIISGSMRVAKVLSDAEVQAVNDKAGVADLPRMPAQELEQSGALTGGQTVDPTELKGDPQGEADDKRWRALKPKKTKAGKFRGAPEWVKNAGGLGRLRSLLRGLTVEGEPGRFWYEDSALEALRITNGDFVQAEKFIGLLAIYSPQTGVFANTGFAIKAYTQWKNGEAVNVKTGTQDEKATAWLERGQDWGGRKVNSFYLNLMKELLTQADPATLATLALPDEVVSQIDAATVDLWVLRALGYELDSAGASEGMAGKYSFSENEIRRLAGMLNAKLEPGERRWLPHQVQAALWTAIKARYEVPSVKKATIAESVKKGFSKYDEETGKWAAPTQNTPNKRKHMMIWRKHALAASDADVQKSIETAKGSFGTMLGRIAQNITWEAVPSTDLNLDITTADPDIRAQFTEEAVSLLVDDSGHDLLADQLGVPLNLADLGTGGYAGDININAITTLIPIKPAGVFDNQTALDYARAIQYIFKQDAVPLFRAESKIDFSKDYSIENGAGRTVRSFPTQAAAEADLAARRTKLEASTKKDGTLKTGVQEKLDDLAKWTVGGGALARGVRISFNAPLDKQAEEAFFQILIKHLGEDAGYSKINGEIVVINFRDDETGLPFVNDEVFMAGIQNMEQADGQGIGISKVEKFGSEGQYGPVHDWGADPDGQVVLDAIDTSGRPNLQSWVRDRRAAFEAVVERYSGEGLKARQEELQLHQRDGVDPAKGSFRQEQDTYGNVSNIITLTENANRTTFLHELGHFWLFQMHKDLADPRLTAQGKARLERMMSTAKGWFQQSAADAWRDYNKLQQAALTDAAADPKNASKQRKAEQMTLAVEHAKANGGAKYMALVAQNFMDGTVDFGTDLEVGFHEMWARGVEKWLGEGRAPSSALRHAFSSFSTWVIGVYRKLRALNVNLTPEIRSVFDRLVATEEAINMETSRTLYTIPEELRQQATPKELERLDRAIQEAMIEARSQMQGKVGKQLARENSAEFEARRQALTDEIAEELSQEPIYKIDEILATGGQNFGPLFLDRKEFIAVYGKDAAKKMPRRIFTRVKGAEMIELSLLAQLSGFPTQEAMVNAMLAPHPPLATKVEAQVQGRLMEEFGSAFAPDRVQDEAAEVVQNSKMIELMALQARLVRRLAKGPLKSAAERRAQEEGVSTTAAEDRGAVEDAERGAEGAPSPEDAVPGEIAVAQAKAEKAANVAQRKAQRAAVRKIRELARSMDVKAIKEAARQITDRMKVGKMTPQKFRQTADRLAKKAQLAIARRDYEAAADLLQERTLNLEIAREVAERRGKVDRSIKRVQKILRRPDKSLKSGYDMDVIQSIRFMLEPYGLSRKGSSNMTAEQFLVTMDKVDAEQASKIANLVTDARRNAAPYIHETNNKDPYKAMPHSEFVVLMKEIDGLLKMASDGKTIMVEGQAVTFDQVNAEVARSTLDLAPVNAKRKGRGTDKQRNWKNSIGTIRTATRRMELWARAIDGGSDGPIQKYFVRPVMNGITAYQTARQPIMKRLLDVMKPIADELAKPTHIDAPELDGYFFSTKGELLHFILHTGNESNLRKLLIGGAIDVGDGKKYQWSTTTDPRDAVDTTQLENFLTRIFSDGTITTQDVALLNEIWAIFEDTKTDAQAAHRSMHGHFFDEIEASPRETPLGTLTGGYVPALSDNLMNPEGVRKEAADDLSSASNAAIFPGAEDGFTKGRVEYNQPLALDLRMITMHIDRVLKFSHIGPPVRNAARIAVNRKFQDILNKFDHFAVGEIIIPWLQRSARQTVTTPGNGSVDRAFNALSRNVGLQTMMGNMVNAAQQFTGLITATSRVSPKLMIKNLARFRKDGQSAREYVSSRSRFMAVRFLSSVNDMGNQVNNILLSNTVLSKVKYYANLYGYFAQQAAQNLVDPVVWMAAEEQAINEGLWQRVYDDHVTLGFDVARAKADAATAMYADEIVRSTQTPLGAQDVSRIEASYSFVRIFMKFQGYFNNMMNLSATEFKVISRDIGFKGKNPGRFFYLYLAVIMAPAIIAEGIAMAAGGDFDDLDEKDDDEIAAVFFNLFVVSQGKFVGNFFPGLGATVNFAWGQGTKEFYDDRLSVSPIISIGEQAAVGVGRLVADGIEYAREGIVERDPSAMVKDLLNAIAILFGLPTGWFNKPVTYLMKVDEGNADPEGVIDYVQGFLRGRDGTED